METDSFVKSLKLSHVPRWSIIDMTKSQAVSDHVYRVMVISVAIYNVLITIRGNDVDLGVILRLALFHDLEEGATGDIPTPIKVKMGLKDKSNPKTTEDIVVKLADILESMIQLRRYATNPDRLIKIHEKVLNETIELLGNAANIPREYMDWVNKSITRLLWVGYRYE